MTRRPDRRVSLATMVAGILSVAVLSQGRRRYKFTVRTKGGSVIGTTVEGRGVQEAEAKVTP